MAHQFVLKPKEWQLVLPLAVFLLLFYVAPLAVLIAMGFSVDRQFSSFSLEHYAKFWGDTYNLKILFDTLWLGLKVMLLSLILGYPLAYFYLRTPRFWQEWFTFLILLPLLTSVVVRSFAWVVILGRNGVINTVLLNLGVIGEPLRLLFTHQGVVLALTQIHMPLMVLSLIASMVQIDRNLESASASLGAGTWCTFWRVTVPLTLPGIISGCLLVFVLAVSSFATPSIIGGSRLLFMPTYIYQQAMTLLNFSNAAAVSTVLLLSVLVIVVAFSSFNRIVKTHGNVT